MALLAAALVSNAAPAGALPSPSVAINPQSSTATVATEQLVTATVTIPGGIVTGVMVTFTAAGTGTEAPTQASGAADANGDVPFKFASKTPGVSTVTATAMINQTLFVGTASVTWVSAPPPPPPPPPAPPAPTIVLTPAAPVRQAGQIDAVTALVRDGAGNTVPDGTPVVFSASGTGAEAPGSGSLTTTAGIATFFLTSSVAGTTTVAASAAGVGAATTITWTAVPQGYWLVASDGGLFAFGDAVGHSYGSLGSVRLNQPVVGMAPTASGSGYWMVASDGGIFAFGDAVSHSYGSLGSIRLNQPVVGMARTASGNGYWMVASDGGIFAFGDAVSHSYGSLGSIRLNKPVVGMAATASGNGYWLVASDGGMFAFGDAQALGSTASIRLNRPIVGMAGIG
jgi:hypothetical protein